jgi:hypothetical protein
VSGSKLAAVRSRLGLRTECDRWLKDDKAVFAYIEDATRLGRINA